MKKLLTFLLLFVPISVAYADHHEREEAAVLAVIDEFFTAMTVRDAETWERLLLPDGMVFVSRIAEDGTETVSRRSMQDSIDSLTPEGPRLLERIWDPVVEVRGGVAIAWTPYDFHVDGKFSHCGDNSFQLIKENGQWKIANVIYTHSVEDCEPSPLGPVE